MLKVQRGYLKISGSLFSAFHFRYSESSKATALSVTAWKMLRRKFVYNS